MNTLAQIAAIIGYLSAIFTAIILVVRPVRDKVFNFRAIVSGMKCLLRADILRTYYKYHTEDTIHQHERENIDAEYKAYKALGGNSFIDTIYNEMKEWEVEQ